MRPTRRGQIVKYQVPNESFEKLYVVLNFIEAGIRSKARIYQLKTGQVSMAFAKDLEVDEGQTFELDYYLKYGNHDLF
ncbi:hypothetical protein [uncultured Winogradskyella sp.]|uniref:hypothetical protein n=1 Tax=uncultured Winogradskyella sp. TaxID=395353 RepID=UPI002627C8AF|nr:hypothetical protein [uncultured Winogradskyella sp.]